MNTVLQKISISYLIVILAIITKVWTHRHRQHNQNYDENDDLSLWINEQQVKMFSGKNLKHFCVFCEK